MTEACACAESWLDCELRGLDGRPAWSRYRANSTTTSPRVFEQDGIHAGTYVLVGRRLVERRVIELGPGERYELVVD